MTTFKSQSALFDTYNARFLEPRAIARSFIMPRQIFGLLCKNENSLLIGPRGSGKTTLMKMLRPSALRAWTHTDKSRILDELAFTAVYIAADSAWNARMAVFPADSTEYKVFDILQNATFVTYAMMSMLDAVSECASIDEHDDERFQKFRIKLNSNLEGELSAQLAKRWLLDLEFSSLRAARLALHDRIQSIDQIYFRAAGLGTKIQLSDLANYEFLSLNALHTMQAFVTTVNELLEEPNRTWSFCIDEIEILYPSYQSSLMRSLRSTADQRLRFKISASPFSRTPFHRTDPTVPMGGHDFTPITLTYARKHEGVRFGRQMLEALILDAGLHDGPTELFGKSQFEPELPHEERRPQSRYEPGGVRYKALKNLERNDPAFARYLRRRNIDLASVAGRSEEERAEVRKLIQIAEIRREFGLSNVLKTGGRDILRHRSRKRVSDLYTGAESLLTLCEGNPRWLIGVFRPLLEASNAGRPVQRSKQARSVSTAIARFLSLLSTIAFPQDQRRVLPITKMIDKIGEHFFQDITAHEFKTEPDLSFVIDKGVKEDELDAIGAALNQGAFVFIPSQESEHCAGDIRNRRFRLSYMLCPRYKLPLMYGQPVVLSSILHSRSAADDTQFTLADFYR
jgi:hypothetical protein